MQIESKKLNLRSLLLLKCIVDVQDDLIIQSVKKHKVRKNLINNKNMHKHMRLGL